MPPILEVKNLSKSYSLRRAASSLREAFQLMRARHFHVDQQRPEAFWALRDISFDVSKGESVGFIGRNGAGKSTLLKILSRVTQPSAGEVNIYGRTGSLLGIGAGFHPDFTGRENVFLNGVMLGMSHGEVRRNFEKIAAFAELERFLDTPIKYYSSGMYVRLAFAVAAHFEPEVLLIDEVLGVGDASFQKKCFAKLEEIRRRGSTVLIVSHDLLSVQRFCDRAILLEDGRVLDMGKPDAVVANYLDVIQRDQ
ncbi:MAG TPA: ABC transporter ATP-binding protein [Pyrinomonadaceae bacterium]